MFALSSSGSSLPLPGFDLFVCLPLPAVRRVLSACASGSRGVVGVVVRPGLRPALVVAASPSVVWAASRSLAL